MLIRKDDICKTADIDVIDIMGSEEFDEELFIDRVSEVQLDFK